MAVSATPVFPQNPKIGLGRIQNSDGSARVTIYTGNTNGTKISALMVAMTDTVAKNLQFSIVRSSVNYFIGCSVIPPQAGSDSTNNAINMLANVPGLPVDNDGQPYLFLESGDVLSAQTTTTLTAATEIHLVAPASDF